MSIAEEYDKSRNIPPAPEMQQSSKFFVGIIFNGNDQDLECTLQSVQRQRTPGLALCIHVFYQEDKKLPPVNSDGNSINISFNSRQDFFQKLVGDLTNADVDYCSVINSGEAFFEGAFDSVNRIFRQYDEIDWLTGIQSFRTPSGYNITLGSTAIRRWSDKIYERNLYKNSGRFIAPASTFWRKRIWSTVSPVLHFVAERDFCEDLWVAMFRSYKLYTCKIYLSSSSNYHKINKQNIRQPNSPALLEDGIWGRVKEFFFINNIPYLRVFYRAESGYARVIRFDHNTQAYFLSEY